MAKPKEKRQALRLRTQGESIKTIANKLGVSKGSVSLWCQEIELTSMQKEKLKKKQIISGHKGRMIGAEVNRQQRLDNINRRLKDGKKEIASLTKRDLLMLGIGLYWGEGIKSRTGQAALVNSDPAVIICAKKWFQDCLNVPVEDFRPYIYISESHNRRAGKILSYWARNLNIPRSQFHDLILLKGRPKKFYKNHNSYYGVLSLRIRRGTDMKYRIQGLIEACKENVGIAQLVVAPHS